jgi:hypothetical protein
MANRVQFLICVLVLLARASLATGTNDAVVLARGQPLAWIRTSADKTHFVCDGTDQRFVPWGFNYDHDDAGRFLEYYWADDWAKVTNDFREMKILGANVVRVSPQFCCLMKSPEQPDETNLARLGKLVRLAEETGLYLDVTGLGCYHKDEVPAWYDAMDESARWKVQARYWRAVADICKDSPAIFCYDLINEPVPSGDRKGDWLPGQPLDGSYFVQRLTTDMRDRTEKKVAKEWIAEMSAAIRAIDKRHMIAVGLACWEVPFGPGARSAFCDPEVSAALDFLSVHYYPRQGKLADDLAILKHYEIGKPLVIEEIFPLSADVGTTEEFIRRSRMEADGWISFYWGKTPEEYDKEPGIKAALTGGWLRHFCALRGEMLGGPFSPSDRTESPPPPMSVTLLWLFRQKRWLGAAALLCAFYLGIRGFLKRNNRFIAAASIVCFAVGLVLSQRVEPGVRVKTVTLAGNTPALEFLPAGLGPHPVALLAHGFAGSKMPYFCYGEALAAAGFECFALDLPGHGASPQQAFSLTEAVRTVSEVARAVGPVDVFLGHSMGVYAGSGAVRNGDLKLKLFIAEGALPDLGEHGPPLLLLAGQFDEVYPPARLRERTDARLVLSPWSEHVFETWDPVLVNAAVKAACAAVGKVQPAPPTCWRWRLAGVVLGVLGALGLAFALPGLPSRWAWVRGPLVSGIFLTAFVITAWKWLDLAPHPRLFPLQITGMVVTLIVLMGASRIHFPRWILFGLAVLVVAIRCMITSSSFLVMLVLLVVLILLVGTILGVIATHRGSRLDGNIAIAIVVGCSLCLFHRPSYYLDVPPRVLIKLDTKLLNACVGQYEFAPDAAFPSGIKLTIRREGDQLVAQAQGRNVFRDAFHIYPESETNFIATFNGAQFTFIKNDEGEVTGVIHHLEWLPDIVGKKLNNK